ncbi:mitochondrial inner membrane peptidase complex catalytic subunit [Halteromyces radiatus]|uniref:mitochondrial inner membrane peptidase complex catalytic subunit n=1 Tax=Halteromyces radiatus TaxID=101107 RepID=UPI00221EA8E3|nr:mitochondrial inner membrane peptidase complex catalytic subunit [Halteromyces radiatus]KAI8096789.1 mitochondrial inner membrane peptidase complex catalytic subunit [Halteromyces radiatus]
MPIFGRTTRLFFRGSIVALQFGCFVHLFNQHVAELTFCVGPSMLPTFNMTGDIMLIEHISQRFKSLQTGDVIVCISPSVPGRAVLKRIIGMPGDNICVDPTAPDRKFLDVPEGHVWIGGDNLSNSTDSREYGPVAMGLIRGKVIARAWPEFNWIRNGLIPIDTKDN